MAFPRIVISGMSGGSGKTIISLGVIASCRKRGMVVAPFKKGPDFIDAGWLALAAGHPCHNLDTFLIPPDQILLSFANHALASDVAVIEGNRGLYDSINLAGDTSTSELAKLLNAPVVLVIDCTKTTRTVAAMILGCVHFDPAVNICAVILNRVAGPRHESILRTTIEHHCHIPVLGAIPKMGGNSFPERHMGLVPTPEHKWAEESIQKAADMAERYLDLDRLLSMIKEAPALTDSPLTLTPRPHWGGQNNVISRGYSHFPAGRELGRPASVRHERVEKDVTLKKNMPLPRIAVIRDAAFQFYYPENIEALEAAGAEVVMLSALEGSGIQNIDGLYIGGGFPETHARILAKNKKFRSNIRSLAQTGLPIYAECGGLMYMGESLIVNGATYPMVGVFPAVFGLSKRPEGHGYTILEVERKNPYYEPGTIIRGHEFHYSKVLNWQGKPEDLCFRMIRGSGFNGKRDGLCYKNTLATYSHVHALGTPAWAKAMVEASLLYQKASAGRSNRPDFPLIPSMRR